MCALLQAANRAHQLQLHVERQAGRDAVGVDLVGGQPLGLEEDLVAGLAGEAVDLVLDRRAVARADAFDHAGEHRRAVEAAADDLVRARVGVRDPARQLPRDACRAGRGTRTPARADRPAAPPSPKNRCCARRAAAACPVFRRPTGSFSSRRRAARVTDAGSPARPAW